MRTDRIGNFEKRNGIPKTTRRTRRKTTINDLLAKDSVNTVLQHLAEHRTEMSSLFAIYEDKEGNIEWTGGPDITLSRVVFLLEQVKYCLLSGEDE